MLTATCLSYGRLRDFLGFFFPNRPGGNTPRPILTQNGSNDVGSRKDVPFGVKIETFSNPWPPDSQNRHKLPNFGRDLENFRSISRLTMGVSRVNIPYSVLSVTKVSVRIYVLFNLWFRGFRSKVRICYSAVFALWFRGLRSKVGTHLESHSVPFSSAEFMTSHDVRRSCFVWRATKHSLALPRQIARSECQNLRPYIVVDHAYSETERGDG